MHENEGEKEKMLVCSSLNSPKKWHIYLLATEMNPPPPNNHSYVDKNLSVISFSEGSTLNH